MLGLILPLLLAVPRAPAVVALEPGMVITESVRIAPGDYLISSPADDYATAAVVVQGDGITVDFAGAVLRGTPATVEPNERVGLGILVKGENVTIKNATVRGYKVGLTARGAHGLRILDSDFSYNWKARLASDLEREDTSDWMSFHRNENDEWLRYGAAVYLRDCDRFEVRGLRVRGGQCGLMLMECDHGLVWNNDLSFLSAVGLGMYLSSDNKVMHNRFDWCVRGYSHGVYNRGQDSTGILIYEQSHRNVFAYNSATHGGDGFFLWAGQTTMDTGQGGCNDNLLYGNDWSHSPANGIESTFSRNNFVNNLMLDSWHGVWGGYSFDNKILGNVFGGNGEAIAIEHGQRNSIKYNAFDHDFVALYLWQNPTQDPDWGYPKFVDTRNFGTRVEWNRFRNATEVAIDLNTGSDIRILNNRFERNNEAVRPRGTLEAVVFGLNDVFGQKPVPFVAGFRNDDNTESAEGPEAVAPPPGVMSRGGNAVVAPLEDAEAYLARFRVPWNPWPDRGPILPPQVRAIMPEAEAARAERELREYVVRPLPGGMDPFLPAGALRGRRYILVDHWGPYDFRSPVIWPREATALGGGVGVTPEGSEVRGTPVVDRRFEILGPPGAWRVKSLRGATLDQQEGTVPGRVLVSTPMPAGKATDVEVVLEYVGAETTDYRGIVTPAGQPVEFRWAKQFFPIDWTVRYWNWDDTTDPRTKPDAFRALIAQRPILEERTNDLNLRGFGFGRTAVGSTNFTTVAEGALDVPAGEYTLNLTTDDGARLWLDDRLLIDEWKYQGPTLYTREVRLAGRHRIRVEHFQIDGYATLKVELKPKR